MIPVARSTYIYLVMDEHDGGSKPVVACTVRYEVVAWLGRRADWLRAEAKKRQTMRLVDVLTADEPPSFRTLNVYRLRDGDSTVGPVLLGTAAQVLAERERIEQGRPA